MDLESLGWCEFFDKAYSVSRKPDSIPARVIRAHNRIYELISETGEVTAEIAGKLYYTAVLKSELPVVGDWVIATMSNDKDKALIFEVLPRKTKFSRRAGDEKIEEQVLASNIDTAVIVTDSCSDFNIRRLERYLTIAKDGNTGAVILINKSDLCDNPDALIEEAKTVAGDTPIITISAVTGLGFDKLDPIIQKGETFALFGSSGVGKSTIINRLLGYERQRVNTIIEKRGRGKHTTTQREMVFLDNGAMIIDSPGLREVGIWIQNVSFDDIEKIAKECKFRDCAHKTEPGCAVIRAIENNTIPQDRYKSYIAQKEEMEFAKRHNSVTKRNLEKSAKKKIAKLSKAYKKYKQNE